MTQLSYKEKYKQVKQRLARLKEMRYEAVAEDIKSLRRKIEEHKNAHAITINEIKRENQLLTKDINDLSSITDQIYILQNSIAKLKATLSLKDSIINSLLKYKFLSIKCIGPCEYRIYCLDNDNFIGELYKLKNDTIYRPIKVPQTPRFRSFSVECEVKNLDEFCNFLYMAIYQ